MRSLDSLSPFGAALLDNALQRIRTLALLERPDVVAWCEGVIEGRLEDAVLTGKLMDDEPRRYLMSQLQAVRDQLVEDDHTVTADWPNDAMAELADARDARRLLDEEVDEATAIARPVGEPTVERDDGASD
jgi:hypothetical protein